MPDKNNIKTKLLHIHYPKFNSLKPEKSPDKMISSYKQMSKNIKNKSNISNSTNTKNTSASTSHGASTYLNKNMNKSNNSFNNKSDKQKTSFQDLTTTQTIRSDNNPGSENSEFINDNINQLVKVSQNDNFVPLIQIAFSDKILLFVEKISNFLIISTKEQNFLYNQEQNCFVKKSNFLNIDLEIKGPKLAHSRKHLSANLDRVFIDNLLQSQKEYEINKLDMFYQEIESIYEMSVELNESVKINLNINKSSPKYNRNDEVNQLTTQALLNIEMIKDYSDGRLSTYKRLLSSCISNFKEISEEILKRMRINKEENNEKDYFNIDPYSTISSPIKEIHNLVNSGCANQSSAKDKSSLINEKLEMLRNLREKKDQILYENQTHNENIMKKIKNTRTIKAKDKTMTEIDPSDSYLNENVVVNYLPTSNINNVNKPSEQNLPYKKCTEELEGIEFELKGNSHDESEIIFNLDEINEDQGIEIIKQSNDTILQTCNDFMKSHKRSKSHYHSQLKSPNHTPSMSNQTDKP